MKDTNRRPVQRPGCLSVSDASFDNRLNEKQNITLYAKYMGELHVEQQLIRRARNPQDLSSQTFHMSLYITICRHANRKT